jgi:hypothetical protein
MQRVSAKLGFKLDPRHELKRAVAVDNLGSVYAAGSYSYYSEDFQDGLDFGNGVRVDSKPESDDALLLVKYSKDGRPEWARAYAWSPSSRYESVAVARDGSVYAAGSLSGNKEAELGDGVVVRAPAERSNALLVKYDRAGKIRWARTIASAKSSSGVSQFSSVVAAQDDAVYAAGIRGDRYFPLEELSFGEGVAAKGLSSGTGYAPLVVKYDATGKALWARTTKSGRASSFSGLALGPNAALNAVGSFEGQEPVAFGDGVTTKTMEGAPGPRPALVIYSDTGAAQWVDTDVKATLASELLSVASAPDGSLYSVGAVTGAGRLDLGASIAVENAQNGTNVLIVKYE